jgi:hypothetical protein
MEDDGTVTGLHSAHQPPDGIAALVENRTVPSVQVRIDGSPEGVPILPHDIPARLSQLGAQDVSRQTVTGSKLADLDDAERIRLRQFIERNQGDASLASLSNEELDGVLGLTARDGETTSPTLVHQRGEIVRTDVMDLCQLSRDQASRLLARLVKAGILVAQGDWRWRKYLAGPGRREAE